MSDNSYKIVLPQFEGPFDLLLFFIERDELDIYNIPITRIINDFLRYIHEQDSLNIELSSEFILFVSTLMRIKARMLLPRKELNADGEEIDPRLELVDKILEYKKYKEASVRMAEMEAERLLLAKRGNVQQELAGIGEEAGEGTEIQAITLFRLMRAFERALQKYSERLNRPVHTVVRYHYTMEQTRANMIALAQRERTLSFRQIFSAVENRVHAIFTFLSLLELVQQNYLRLLTGEGKNSFVVEYNETAEGLTDEEHMRLL